LPLWSCGRRRPTTGRLPCCPSPDDPPGNKGYYFKKELLEGHFHRSFTICQDETKFLQLLSAFPPSCVC
jgi:hypothetical protein